VQKIHLSLLYRIVLHRLRLYVDKGRFKTVCASPLKNLERDYFIAQL
jgi:hypothetical protein